MTGLSISVLAKFDEYLDELISATRDGNLSTPDLALEIMKSNHKFAAVMLATAIQRLAYIDRP